MRRSFRDAIVGFSILGGMIAFAGTMLWLRGFRVNSNAWNVTADFSDASGLSEQSPVTYRGILVGSVGKISITPESVQANLEINKANLLLPIPVYAKVVKGSLLGGDVQVSLVSKNKLVNRNTPIPSSENCPGKGILCEGDVIKGEPLASISSLTSSLDKLVSKAGEEDIVSNLVESTKQFDKTQRELESLILQAKNEIIRAEPIITEMAKASAHLSNILAAIDNPETLNDIKETASSTRSLTKQIDTLGNELNELMDDEELRSAFRSVTIGLGELFNDLYPSKTLED